MKVLDIFVVLTGEGVVLISSEVVALARMEVVALARIEEVALSCFVAVVAFTLLLDTNGRGVAVTLVVDIGTWVGVPLALGLALVLELVLVLVSVELNVTEELTVRVATSAGGSPWILATVSTRITALVNNNFIIIMSVS